MNISETQTWKFSFDFFQEQRRNKRCFDDGLGELFDEAQFEIRDGEEARGHDDQSQVVLPKTPRRVIDPLLLQKLLPRTPGIKIYPVLKTEFDPNGKIYI